MRHLLTTVARSGRCLFEAIQPRFSHAHPLPRSAATLPPSVYQKKYKLNRDGSKAGMLFAASGFFATYAAVSTEPAKPSQLDEHAFCAMFPHTVKTFFGASQAWRYDHYLALTNALTALKDTNHTPSQATGLLQAALHHLPPYEHIASLNETQCYFLRKQLSELHTAAARWAHHMPPHSENDFHMTIVIEALSDSIQALDAVAAQQTYLEKIENACLPLNHATRGPLSQCAQRVADALEPPGPRIGPIVAAAGGGIGLIALINKLDRTMGPDASSLAALLAIAMYLAEQGDVHKPSNHKNLLPALTTADALSNYQTHQTLDHRLEQAWIILLLTHNCLMERTPSRDITPPSSTNRIPSRQNILSIVEDFAQWKKGDDANLHTDPLNASALVKLLHQHPDWEQEIQSALYTLRSVPDFLYVAMQHADKMTADITSHAATVASNSPYPC